MSKSASPEIIRWTRDGLLHFKWAQSESFEALLLPQKLRDYFLKKFAIFQSAEQHFHDLHRPWRLGFFLFGPSGSGKSAASKGIADFLGWTHFSIPAHEILDSHFFESALASAVSQPKRVIVLEDVDRMVQTMETEAFFSILDHALVRADGTIWFANSKHPENAPKTQLLRPGRFDEWLRMEFPHAELRKEIIKKWIWLKDFEWDEATLSDWVNETDGLSYSHFEEMNQLGATLKLEKADTDEVLPALKSYIENQIIAGDRFGGLSDTTTELQERIKHVDPKILMASLDLTDVMKTLFEKVISDAAQANRVLDGDSNSSDLS